MLKIEFKESLAIEYRNKEENEEGDEEGDDSKDKGEYYCKKI